MGALTAFGALVGTPVVMPEMDFLFLLVSTGLVTSFPVLLLSSLGWLQLFKATNYVRLYLTRHSDLQGQASHPSQDLAAVRHQKHVPNICETHSGLLPPCPCVYSSFRACCSVRTGTGDTDIAWKTTIITCLAVVLLVQDECPSRSFRC